MFNKIFKGPHRILKIISVVLIAFAIMSSIILFFIERNNLNIIESSITNSIYKAELCNIVLIIVAIIFSIITIILLIAWLKPALQQPGTVLKAIIVIQAFILLGVILIWSISEFENIISTNHKFLENVKGSGQIIKAINEIGSKETDAIITHALTVLICALGVVLSSLILYGLVDGFGRFVRSLERIAENSKVNNEKRQDQCTCDIEETDCHTSVRTGSQ